MQSGRRGGFRVISVAIKALQQELESLKAEDSPFGENTMDDPGPEEPQA